MKKEPLKINNTCKTRKELSNELGLSLSSLFRRLKALDFILPRTLITPDQQIKIYEHLGYSYIIEHTNTLKKPS